MNVDVYLQVKRSGRTQAHIPALPGCNWMADSPEAAREKAPDQIAAYLAWLRKYGQPAPTPGDPVVPVIFQTHRSTAREGNLIGFFECDRQPVLALEIPVFLSLMNSSRQALLEVTRDLPAQWLSERPAPASWNISQVLRHVAGTERWYLTRILDSESLPVFKPIRSIWDRLEVVRDLVVERLSGLNETQLSAVVADESTELWSARKVFRRYLEHEREHTAHAQEILQGITEQRR